MTGRSQGLRYRSGVRTVRPMVALGIRMGSFGLASCGREAGGVQAQDRPAREGTQVPGPQTRALGKTPALQIGAVQGSPGHQLQDVRGAVRLSNGNLVLADRGTQDLRWFDPSGAHLRTVGGRAPGSSWD